MPRLHHLLLPALALVSLVIYQICLADLYAHSGMLPITLDVDFWIVFFVSMFIVLLVFPTRIERPSDFFMFFYLLISVLWGSVLWQGTGLIEAHEQPLFFLVSILPVFMVLGVRAILTKPMSRLVAPIMLASSGWLPFGLVSLLIISGLATFFTVGGGSFDWEAMYTRRLFGRDAFEGNVLAGYVTNMGTNGVLPILGFLAGYRRSPTLSAFCIIFIIAMFFLLGLKSPAINFVALAGVGFCFRYQAFRRNLVPIALTAILLVYIAALLAFVRNGDTLLADYLVRRISLVQVQIQSYYFDYIANRAYIESVIERDSLSFSGITFLIGHFYFSNPLDNANTNAFIFALANGGIAAYFLSMAGVAIIVTIIDVLARKTGNVVFFALAALFSILLTEQAWTTVLLTSGIALCLALVMLFSYRTTLPAHR